MSSPNLPLPQFPARQCASVEPVDPGFFEQAQNHLDSLAKPRGSLGRLEEVAAKLFAIQESAPITAHPARIITIAADHGVVAEGIASSPQEVTALMVRNFLQGGAGINCLCKTAGAELCIVDAGVDAPPFEPHPQLVNAKIARGTGNIVNGPAMTFEQCVMAVQLGINLAEKAARDGIRVLGTGEMGIGNTTASSALFCAYFGFSPEEMTGSGAGIPAKGLKHKSQVIGAALGRHAEIVRGGDPFAILAALGGLEIAALTGLIIGGAARRIAIVIDGFISTAAFTAASRLAPAVRDYCFFSHASQESGHAKALEALHERPLLELGLRLGEGTGAALAVPILAAAAAIYNHMATLQKANIALA